jgi:hypothetical protein
MNRDDDWKEFGEEMESQFPNGYEVEEASNFSNLRRKPSVVRYRPSKSKKPMVQEDNDVAEAGKVNKWIALKEGHEKTSLDKPLSVS